jgi:hypothetical protein
MAKYGKAVALPASISANYKELLGALYDTFDSGVISGWTIKSGVTAPAAITLPGDQGFVITNGTFDVALANAGATGGIGGVGYDGATKAGVLLGLDPTGEITDITSAGFSVGSRWSDWLINITVNTGFIDGEKLKISWDSDWLFIRLRKESYSSYLIGFYAGWYNRGATNSEGDIESLCLMSGQLESWANYAGIYEAHNVGGDWRVCFTYPDTRATCFGAGTAASNGSSFTTTFLALFTGNSTSHAFLGLIPCILVGGDGVYMNSTPGKAWKDTTGMTIAYNIGNDRYSGCWLALDDHGDPE